MMWDAMVVMGRGEDMIISDHVLLMSTHVDSHVEVVAATAEGDDKLGGEERAPEERPRPSSSGPSTPPPLPTPRPPTAPPPWKCRKMSTTPTTAPAAEVAPTSAPRAPTTPPKAPTLAGPPHTPTVVPPLYPRPCAPAAPARQEVVEAFG
eukprot:2131515-Pyramimonas_sp.AAC.1